MAPFRVLFRDVANLSLPRRYDTTRTHSAIIRIVVVTPRVYSLLSLQGAWAGLLYGFCETDATIAIVEDGQPFLKELVS